MLAQTAFQRVGQRIALLTVFANERNLVFQAAQAQVPAVITCDNMCVQIRPA
jgi:hypothetical protein